MLFIRTLTASIGAALLLSAIQSVGATETPLETAVATGAHLFVTATFGGNGRTCEGCHNDGGKASGQLGDRKLPSLLNAAAIYSRFSLQSCQIRCALPVALNLAPLQGFAARISFRFQAAAEVLDFRISKNDPMQTPPAEPQMRTFHCRNLDGAPMAARRS